MLYTSNYMFFPDGPVDRKTTRGLKLHSSAKFRRRLLNTAVAANSSWAPTGATCGAVLIITTTSNRQCSPSTARTLPGPAKQAEKHCRRTARVHSFTVLLCSRSPLMAGCLGMNPIAVPLPFFPRLDRGAGTVMVDRGGVERDGVTVLSWQRLPSQLVQQHADRMKMKRPHFHPVKPSEPVRLQTYGVRA